MKTMHWMATAVMVAVLAGPAAAQVAVDEDFTDGAFDDYGGAYWTMYGPGTGFKAPNARPFTQSLALTVKSGGSAWGDGAKWAQWTDLNGDGQWQEPELQEFHVDKDEDVVFLYFTAFSDVARSSAVYYGVEVAMMELADDPEYQGDPHYGHDLSFEAEQVFSTKTSDQVQLFGNVENDQNWVTAVRKAHYNGVADSAKLSTEYDNYVIWRNKPGTGTTNIEQWGHNMAGDYTVASEMNGEREPGAPDAIFDHIQITLFRGNADVATNSLIRDGVSADDAQIGILNVHVGVTHKTDFNVDYVVDAADLIVWNSFQGAGGKTLLTGDANNDANTDATDLGLWKAAKGTDRDPNLQSPRSFINVPAGGSGGTPDFAYVPSGGLYMHTDGETLVAWLIPGPEALTTVAQPGGSGAWWQAYVDGKEQWADETLAGYASLDWVEIDEYPEEIPAESFFYVVYGFASGGGGTAPVRMIDRGDTDLDGDVDAVDLATLGLQWSPSPAGNDWLDGDFDGDGDVDAVDLAALGLGWNPSGSGTPVPEPASLGLVMAGLAAAAAARRAGRTF